MGLDTTHDCWHGAYSSFTAWRRQLCKVAGLPPLMLMEGFYKPGDLDGFAVEKFLPISWECLKPSALHIVINHSDCDGEIEVDECGPLAEALEEIAPRMGDWQEATEDFAKGLRCALERKEVVGFH